MQRLLFRISIVIIVLCIGAFTFLSFFSKNQISDSLNDNEKISIVATIYPLAYFAAGLDPAAEVVTIVGPGMEPHDFEPTMGDVKAIQDASLLLVNRVVDEWAVDAASNRKGPTIYALDSLNLPLEDPHVWLDPIYAQKIVRDIGSQLELIDPSRAEVIRANVEKKVAEIVAIDAAYRETLSSCEIREVVSAHEAFNFLADRYSFTIYGVSGINPEEEPSAAAIAQMMDIVRSHHITIVFFESLSNDALSKTIAQETNVRSEVLDPIESLTAGFEASTGYTEIMMLNLQKLSTAMICR